MSKPRFLILDFETFSSVDIGACGSFKYMESPDFEPLLLAYAFDDEDVSLWDFTEKHDPKTVHPIYVREWPTEFIEALFDPDVLKCAWNCQFEREVIRQTTGFQAIPEQWIDAMHVAAQCGLPMSLDAAGKALGLPEDTAKMKEGKALIRYFCIPCAPTKANGMRERNYPEHAPEKWQTFRDYCVRDVEAERTIYRMLEHWLPNETERKFWSLDARINEKGVRIDRQLAVNAVRMDAAYKEELTQQAIALTGLENPKSVSQIKSWLADQEGKQFPSLNKKVIADVVSQLETDEARRFMAIRSELSKSSTAKYTAMLRSACRDDHCKGCFQFYGASRTGRFAGRLVQFQNMSKNHTEDLDGMRELVRNGHYSALKALYDGVSDPLSELVRTAIIPEPGHRILVADFSAIEARVLAFLSGEEWVLQAFRDGKDIYCETASAMFHVPVQKHGENSELRQKGKVAILACIAEGEQVLTLRGPVPIQDVTPADLVWDGSHWVHHDGVIYKGLKEVITYEGLTATPDHLVFVEGEDRPVRFGDAAARGAHLLQSGANWQALWPRGDHLPGASIRKGLGASSSTDPLSDLREDKLDLSLKSDDREEQRLPKLLSTKADLSEMALQKSNGPEVPLHKSGARQLEKLRSAWDHLRLRISGGSLHLDYEKPWLTTLWRKTGPRPNRQRKGLCTGKPALGNTIPELREQTLHADRGVAAGRLALFEKRSRKETPTGSEPRGDSGRCVAGRRGEAQELAAHKKVVRVYDILNAGPRHRFTVSGVLVHNCGYGGGVGALKAFGADKMGMSEEEMQETVDLWRSSNAHTVAFWKAVERAAVRCIVRRVSTISDIGNIRFDLEDGILWMTLPSGRRLAYYGPQYDESTRMPGKKTISYMGVEQQTRRWARIETYGPKLVENITQATARDVLREAMFSLDEKGFDIRATVHDEVICTEPIGGKTVEEMCAAMCPEIKWAPGLPLRADGYEGAYYFKD